MAVPEHKTQEVIRLQAIMDGLSEEEIFKFPNLNNDDYRLIGLFVQSYNYIELNLRRSIEVFVRKGFIKGSAAGRFKILPTSELVPTLIGGIEALDLEQSEKSDIINKLLEIQNRHSFRHLLAHWAGRRFPSDDAYVFFTKDGRESKKIGIDVAKDSVITAVVLAPNLRELYDHIVDVEEWLATKTSEWYCLYMDWSKGDTN